MVTLNCKPFQAVLAAELVVDVVLKRVPVVSDELVISKESTEVAAEAKLKVVPLSVKSESPILFELLVNLAKWFWVPVGEAVTLDPEPAQLPILKQIVPVESGKV